MVAAVGKLVPVLARTAGCALLVSLPALGAEGNVRETDSPALACATSRNSTLMAYTFDLSVAMRMRHFPWLRFHMAGTGQYQRGRNYVVTFTQRPVFAKAFKNIDLSALDPSMWSRYYTIQFAGTQAGMSTFVLRPRDSGPQESDPLRQAVVKLDSQYATRSVEMQYADGDITLKVTPGPIAGYRLPVSGNVSIDMPGHDLAAQAAFSDYTITHRATEAGAPATNPPQCAKGTVLARLH
jgi:hypothetical protein